MQANREDLIKQLDALTEQVNQMISVGHWSYKDILLLEVKERERHYRKIMENREKKMGSIEEIIGGIAGRI